MTSLPTAYTPLESLLLFQALRVEGVTPSTFARISEQLNSVPLIRNDPTYDVGRLGPDALRQLYLNLLKDEVKHELQRQSDKDQQLANGSLSPASRKRKATSPSLPSVQEAAQHSHLIPQLVAQLYARYRENTVKEIREYERRHAVLSRDVGGVDTAKANGTLQKQGASSGTQSPMPPTLSQSQMGAGVARYDHARPTSSHSNGAASIHDSDANALSKRYPQAKIDTVVNHSNDVQLSPAPDNRRVSSNTTLPSFSDATTQPPQHVHPSKGPSSAQLPHLAQGGPTAYAQHSVPSPQPLYGPQHGHASMASPQLQSSLSRPSSSPRPILPPSASGMKIPQSPVHHHTASPNMRSAPGLPQQSYQTSHRGVAGPLAGNENASQGYQPGPGGYYQSSQQNLTDRRHSYQAQQAVQPGMYPPHQQPPHTGGYQLQPFYLDPKQQGNIPPKQQHLVQQQYQQNTPRQIQPSAYAQGTYGYPHYPLAPATGPRPVPQQSSRLISDIVAALATPPRDAPRRPLWKSERRPLPIAIPSVPNRPEVEPLSPTISRKSPVRSVRSTRNAKMERVDTKEQESLASNAVPDLLTAPSTGARRGRPRKDRNKSPHSVVSSIADRSTRARTRSDSVSTVTGTHAHPDHRPSSRGQVKNEPSTPTEMPDDSEVMPEPATTPTGRMTRQRRGTLQSQPQHMTKRKRRPSLAAADDDAENAATPPPRSTTITAYRGFDKTSATLVENISSHKHAAYYREAVRDKKAEGYSEIIKRPQHLKGIKSALLAGRRAVAAVASAESGNVMELERSTDLMPPKAIVNATQLEKEVMRTMANAAMFNPGEDGLVSDTREMFEDVEAMFTEWRDAEQETAGSGVGIASGAVGDEDDGRAKRRKP